MASPEKVVMLEAVDTPTVYWNSPCTTLTKAILSFAVIYCNKNCSWKEGSLSSVCRLKVSTLWVVAVIVFY